MVFWIAVAVGRLFAWAAVQIGFYGAWIMFFNLVLSAYMAHLSYAGCHQQCPGGHGDSGLRLRTDDAVHRRRHLVHLLWSLLCLPFRPAAHAVPQRIRQRRRRLAGLSPGFLVCSFTAFTFSLTPLSEMDFSKSLGLDASSQGTNVAYMCWWCNRLQSFIATTSVPSIESSDATATLLDIAPDGNAAAGQTSRRQRRVWRRRHCGRHRCRFADEN